MILGQHSFMVTIYWIWGESASFRQRHLASSLTQSSPVPIALHPSLCPHFIHQLDLHGHWTVSSCSIGLPMPNTAHPLSNSSLTFILCLDSLFLTLAWQALALPASAGPVLDFQPSEALPSDSVLLAQSCWDSLYPSTWAGSSLGNLPAERTPDLLFEHKKTKVEKKGVQLSSNRCTFHSLVL